MSDGSGDGGPRPWQDGVEMDLRHHVLDKILEKLVQLYQGKPAPSHDIKRIAVLFEQKMFTEAGSKEDYVKRIAHKLVIMEHNQQRVLQAASASNQQVQTGCQMQPVNRIQEAHGGNSSITAMPTMGSHERQSSQVQSLPITPSGLCPVQEQHMSDPVALNMHTKNRQTDAVPMSDKILKPYPAIVSLSSPGVHPSQMMQQGEGHTQNKLLTMQMQQINFSSGNATSVPPSQGKPVQPNEQQNLLSHNSRGNCTLPQQQLRMNQQGPEVNQQKMNKHNSQFLAAKQVSISDMHTGHPREWNSQQNAGMNVGSPLQKDKHIENGNSAYGLHSATPQTGASTGNAEEIDWREEMFQQMKTLKDAYLSDLVELDQVSFIPKITKEKFESLPKEEADKYKFKVHMKKRIRIMLNFLQLEKSNIPANLRGQLPMFVKNIQDVLHPYRRKKVQMAEMHTGCHSHISPKKPQITNLTGDPARSSGCTSSQQKLPEQLVAFQLRQNTATRTPAVSQENHSNILLGVGSSCVTVRSPGSVQSLLSNKLQDYRTPSPVTKECPVKVSSLSTSAKSIYSSPVAKPGAVSGASPSVSSPIAKPSLKGASSSASEKSILPSPVEKQNDGAAAASNGSTTNLLIPTSLVWEEADLPAEHLQHGGAESPVAKKPINRLIDAVRSLSPAELKSSADSIRSVISMDDWVPHGEFNTFQQWPFFSMQGGSSPPNKIKRIFETTASFRESSSLVDTWEDETNLEYGAKRQKTQSPRSAVLDEIEAANCKLMDTITRIVDENVTDGMTCSNGGTLIQLSYTGVSLAPDLKSLLATSKMPIVTPTKLLVPADYPRSCPVLVTDEKDKQIRNMFSEIFDSADVAFRNTIKGIPEPRTIWETIREWDTCVRRAVVEFSQRLGGGTFSSRYGGWETLGGA